MNNTVTRGRPAANDPNAPPHIALEDVPIHGAAYREAREKCLRIYRARERVESAIEEAAKTGGLSPDAVADLILDGTIQADAPGDLPSLAGMKVQARALAEAHRRLSDAVAAARRACQQEIAQTLRAGEFGRLAARVAAAQAEVKAAMDEQIAFVKRCDAGVQSELLGYRPE